MNRIEILNAEQHADVKIRIDYAPELGDAIHCVPVVAEELPKLILEYPVFLQKSMQTGQFGLVALLGTTVGENAYLMKGHWRARYVPLHVRRQPFCLVNRDDAHMSAKLAIDMAHPKVDRHGSHRLFNADGEASFVLQEKQACLSHIARGQAVTSAFVKALLDLDLLVRVTPPEECIQSSIVLSCYTVDAEKLASLTDSNVMMLQRHGFLAAAVLLMASQGQLSNQLLTHR